jgi:hypothetical protein
MGIGMGRLEFATLAWTKTSVGEAEGASVERLVPFAGRQTRRTGRRLGGARLAAHFNDALQNSGYNASFSSGSHKAQTGKINGISLVDGPLNDTPPPESRGTGLRPVESKAKTLIRLPRLPTGSRSALFLVLTSRHSSRTRGPQKSSLLMSLYPQPQSTPISQSRYRSKASQTLRFRSSP